MILMNVLIVFIVLSDVVFATEPANQLLSPIIGYPASSLDRAEKIGPPITDTRISAELAYDDPVSVKPSVEHLIDKNSLVAAINQHLAEMMPEKKPSVQVGIEINSIRSATQADVLGFCAINFREKMKCSEYEEKYSRKSTLIGVVTVYASNSGGSKVDTKYDFMILIDGEDRVVMNLVVAQAVQSAVERFANPRLPDSFFVRSGYFSSIQYGVAVFKPNAKYGKSETK